MNTQIAHRPILAFAALLAACSPAAASGPSASPSPTPRVSGTYAYQPRPYLWELVTIVDGKIVNGQGVLLEWSCAGTRWSAGAVPASIGDGSLRVGDERFALAAGVPAAPWRLAADPRTLPAPTCGPVPTTKPGLSPDAARDLITQRVTGIGAVLVPAALPDGLSADVDARVEAFSVTYTGAGVRITLATAVANPQPPTSEGTQRRLFFRGDAGAFYQEMDGSATTARTLLWTETVGSAAVPYALTADGLTSDGFWSIARSLR